MAATREPDQHTVTPKIVATSENLGTADKQLHAIASQIAAETGLVRFKAYGLAIERNPKLAAQAEKERPQREREKAQRDRERMRQEHRERLSIAWPKLAGRFADARLENFAPHGDEVSQASQREVVADLEGLALQERLESGQNFLFIGPCGSGKDHLMHALVWQCFFALNGGVLIRNGSALRRELRDAALSEGGEGIVINRLIDSRLLCISDPIPTGGTEVSDFQADALYHIVDARWNARRPTWCTCNLPLEKTRDAAERVLSAPVWDRLKDGALLIRCNWPSFRRHAEVIG